MTIALKTIVLILLIIFYVVLIINDKWFTEGFDMDPMSYSSSSPMGVNPPSCAGITPSWPLGSLGTLTTISPTAVSTSSPSPTAVSTSSPSPTSVSTSSPSPTSVSTSSPSPSDSSTTMSPAPISSIAPS